jgi:UDP:flavonoid glycosyltransferase YjiC (YdhE family)
MAEPPKSLDILLATWEGGGNVPPTLGAAQRLLARGHRVRIIADAVIGPEARAVGAEFTPWARAPNRADRRPASDPLRDWEAESDEHGFLLLRDRIMCGPALAYAQDVLDELVRRPASVIVTCETLLGVYVASDAANVPLGLLCTNVSLFPLPGLPPLGMGLPPAATEVERAQYAKLGANTLAVLSEGLAPLNVARGALGLQPVRNFTELFSIARRVLLATSPAFDFTADALPPAFRYVGPILTEPPWARHERLARPGAPELPLVVVSFSTTFQDQLGTIENVVKALGELPARGIVTLGPSLVGTRIDAPPNVTVVDFASHEQLMGEAAVVVTHAGHGTVIRALAHGVPLLCMPMGRDQHDNAIRVATRGAGLTLDRNATAQKIAVALSRLLAAPSFRHGARRMAREIANGTGTADFVTEIEALAAAHIPTRTGVRA